MKKSICTAAPLAFVLSALLAVPAYAQGGTNGPAHGIAMHGTPKYPADFTHFDYVNPDAPRGGTVVRDAFGSFDSLNPFIINGTAAVGSDIYDTLTMPSADEPFTRYCLICETIEVPDDRSWVEFVLRDDAYFHDGEPITVDDVIFSFEILKEVNPFVEAYYADITSVEITGARTVRFNFSGTTNLELPLIIAELNVLPAHYWEGREFNETTLEPPLGSGPYRIGAVDPGTSIVLERVEDYWAADHPVNVGQNNFDVLRFEYFRDTDVAREAFKGGDLDFWSENQSKAWATSFDISAVEDGRIVKHNFPHSRGAGMQGFVFNTRRSIFHDPLVRDALAFAFDFEATNANLFYGAYTRTDSYFENSELASSGLLTDAGDEEREILERFRAQLPAGLYDEIFTVPTTSGGAGGARENIARGAAMLDEAGWPLTDGVRVNAETGETLEVEILLVSPAFERIVLPFIDNLERMGVVASARLVDSAQYGNLVESYDFDMLISTFSESESPGNEQRAFWSSGAAEILGGRNIIGIQDPVIDELVDLVISAPSRESLVQRVRALDRTLLWGHYVIPNWHVPHDRLAFWNKFGWPEITPGRGVQFNAWWLDEAKAEALETAIADDGTLDTGFDEPAANADPVATVENETGSEGEDEEGNMTMILIAAAVVVVIVLLLLVRRRKARS